MLLTGMGEIVFYISRINNIKAGGALPFFTHSYVYTVFINETS